MNTDRTNQSKSKKPQGNGFRREIEAAIGHSLLDWRTSSIISP